MEIAKTCDSSHLTEVEIGQLFEDQTDSHLIDRANRHLDECKSCQLLLENFAANPSDWKQFASVMEDQMAVYVDAPEPVGADDYLHLGDLRASGGGFMWSAVAISGLVAFLLIGSLIQLPALIDYLQNSPQSGVPSAPPAPTGPDDAPVAPRPDIRIPDRPPSPTGELQSIREQVEDLNELAKQLEGNLSNEN